MKEITSTASLQSKEVKATHYSPRTRSMTEATKLTASELHHPCTPEQFDFQTTDEIEPIASPLGLERAIEAIKLGIGIPSSGFNIYVMGSTGLGKHTITKQLLATHRTMDKPLYDWCYVNNFRESNKPVALQLPAGMGKRLHIKVQQLIEELKKTVPILLQSEDFTHQTEKLQHELNEKEITAFKSIEDKAKKKNCILKRSHSGYVIHPMKDGNVISKDKFKELPAKEQKIIDKTIEELRLLLVNLLKQVPQWDQEMRDKKDKLEREFVGATLDYLVGQFPEDLMAIECVNHYIDDIKQHILDNIQLFNGSLETEINELTGQKLSFSPFTVYDVNVIVDNSKTEGSPVIYEDDPSYVNLIGRVEHRSELGTFITNFTLIRPGAFHRANGGYLVLDVLQLLNKPFVWDVFKRTLQSKQIRIQPLEQMLSINTMTGLEPQLIPLDIKVILVGDRRLYYLLKHYDPDFSQLFKVQADCSEDISRTPESCQLYTQFIKQLQDEEKTRPLDRNAVARVIEFAARHVDDGEKLTLHRGDLRSIILEANYWAEHNELDVINLDAVQQAIDAKQFRTGYLKECVDDNIHRGIHQIDTEGERIGQINGLSVISLDENMFGRPTRITAAVHLGSSNVIDIEREVELSGASHSKGVMILTAFLREQYEQKQPLSFSATLTFEQSYGMVDGDSASTAELCALLSAIAQIPLKQNIAVTGAIDQHGHIEAIGGVNEKIEGFYDTCNKRGLTGEQGVIIPKTNMVHLMVNEEVRQAVSKGQFHIWAVDHVEQVMTLLTGVPMGKPNAKKQYPPHTINNAIISRIKLMNRAQKSASSEPTSSRRK